MSKITCYDVSYPAVPGAAPSVMHCYRSKDAAEKRALQEVNSRGDLRHQDSRVELVHRDWDGHSTLLECLYL